MVLTLFLFISCAGEPDKRALPPPERSGAAGIPYVIFDYKNRAQGGIIPEWVTRWYEEGIRETEALDAYEGRYAFIRSLAASISSTMKNARIDIADATSYPKNRRAVAPDTTTNR